MAEITVQLLGEPPNLDEIKAELDSLERELFAVNRNKAKLIEVRKLEDRATRLSRAREDELIASTRQKEDSDTTSRISEDDECCIDEQRNIQLARTRQDALRASNRRKKDAGNALRRIDENKECDLAKSRIIERQSELKRAIDSVIGQNDDGEQGESKDVVSQMSEEPCLVQDNNNFTAEEVKQHGVECRPPSDQCLTSGEDVQKTTLFQTPNSSPSTPVRHDEDSNWQLLQDGIHPSRLQRLARKVWDIPSSPSSEAASTTTKSPQPSRPVLTALLEGSGNLNSLDGPSRKRKATSPAPSDKNVSSFLADKKRVSFGLNSDGIQRSRNRIRRPSLRPVVKTGRASRLVHPQGNTNKNYNQHPAPVIPTGPKFHIGRAVIKDNSDQQQLRPTIPTGLKLQSGSEDIVYNSNQQLLPSIPNGPKLRLGDGEICQADVHRLLGHTPNSGVVNLQPILIMHKSDQVHAPAFERAQGIFYTLLEPESPCLGQFPVIVRAEEGGAYNYVGNYEFDGSHLLRDSEVDSLGQDACFALVTSQLINPSTQGAGVVKR